MTSPKNPETPCGGVSGGSPDDFRRDNIAGPHGISYLTKVRKIENRGLDSTGALASAILKEKVILCTVVKIIRDTKKLKILLTFSTRNIKILTRSLQKQIAMHTKNVAYVLMKTI